LLFLCYRGLQMCFLKISLTDYHPWRDRTSYWSCTRGYDS
jgi:hypothetical protein